MGEVLIQNEVREVATITGEQLLQKIAAALGIVMTVESVTTETECEALQLQGSCSNPLNPQRYAMNPALVAPLDGHQPTSSAGSGRSQPSLPRTCSTS